MAQLRISLPRFEMGVASWELAAKVSTANLVAWPTCFGALTAVPTALVCGRRFRSPGKWPQLVPCRSRVD